MANKKRTAATWKQRKAIKLLVSGATNEEQVCEILCISKKTIQRWLAEPYFKEALEARFLAVEKVDAKYRAQVNKQIIESVYTEIIKRISEGKTLKKLSLQKLLSIAKAFNHEIRIDTPGDVTSRSRVEHSTIDDLSERYKKQDPDSKPKLSLVEPPREKKEEAANG